MAAALRRLSWTEEDLDPGSSPAVAFAGAHHLVLAAATRERLADLDYDVDGLRTLMLDNDLHDRGTPADLTVHQGVDMGRPSTLWVHVPAEGGIQVGGMAVELA